MEIKFRIWEGRMHNDNEAKRVLYNISCGSNLTPTHYPIMQFTGLLDKNGKEIYDGDIVKDYYLKQIGKIKFGHPFCQGFTIRYFEHFNEEKINAFDSDDIAWAGLTMDSAKHYEVIGNIYENPLYEKK